MSTHDGMSSALLVRQSLVAVCNHAAWSETETVDRSTPMVAAPVLVGFVQTRGWGTCDCEGRCVIVRACGSGRRKRWIKRWKRKRWSVWRWCGVISVSVSVSVDTVDDCRFGGQVFTS